jgi:apolipoprotein N-acyltransferase
MNSPSLQYHRKYMTRQDRGKAWLAALSGALTAFALPGFGAWPLVLVSLIPFFFSLEQRRGFVPGFVFGVVLFAVDLRWILTLGRFTPWVIGGFMLGVVLLAVPVGLFGLLLAWLRQRRSGLAWFAGAVSLFTLLEFLHSLGPLGLGFSSLHLSLYRLPLALHLASLLGPWSITACIVAVNSALYLCWRERRPRWLIGAGAAVLLLLLPALIPLAPDPGEPIDVAIVASVVRQEVKLEAGNLPVLTDRYMRLGEEAVSLHPDLIVFPESFLPAYILNRPELLDRLAQLAQEAQARLVFGTGEFRDGNIFNSVVLLDSDGSIAGIYHMLRPVPFGEYIPGRAIWERIGLGAFMNSFLTLDLTPGTDELPLQGIATPICFESTFPQGTRALVRNGADLVVTVTNDAWFERSSELEAHFAFAVFRAVENGRWVIQAANGGVSGILSPGGRIAVRTEEEGVLEGEAFLRDDLTLYTWWGDLPLLVLLGLGTLAALIGKPSAKREGE